MSHHPPRPGETRRPGMDPTLRRVLAAAALLLAIVVALPAERLDGRTILAALLAGVGVLLMSPDIDPR